MQDAPAESVGREVGCIPLPISLLVDVLDLVLVYVIGILLAHPAEHGQSRGEEGGVLVAVRGVLIGGGDGRALVDYASERGQRRWQDE
jgi:hypothetical protein